MPTLTVVRGEHEIARLAFEGQPLLSQVLIAEGIEHAHPCGGRGVCGKCAVELTGDVSEPTRAEQAAGIRLSCCARLLGDCRAVLPDVRAFAQIELNGDTHVQKLRPMGKRYGAAIDIGTTTLALCLYDLTDGTALAQAAGANPQASVAADVMGRIGAALEDGGLERLQAMLLGTLQALLGQLCAAGGIGREELDLSVITGNTTMLYLLTEKSPHSLAHAPFEADCLFGGMQDIKGINAYLPRCMSAFVGADITCAVLASGMCEQNQTALLVDVGTNGEIALWHGGRLFVSSTAAGPAFEGSGIHMGCGSIPGAVDKVSLVNGELVCHTIAGAPAVGICGSGLIDAVAVFLAQERVDETGAVDEDRLQLTPSVYLLPEDIRSVQLAKGAIAAGIRTLLEEVGVAYGDVERFYIAGGFGSHLNLESARAIGLLPCELAGRETVIGNAALAGAGMLLLDRELAAQADVLAQAATHVSLGGNSCFSQHYMDEICFPCGE